MGKGVFQLKSDYTIPTNTTMYECTHCKAAKTVHEIREVSKGHTGENSIWPEGIPVTFRICTGCGREDGGWVSADIVGGCW